MHLILVRAKDNEVDALNGRYVADNKETGRFVFYDEDNGLSVIIDKEVIIIKNNGETYSSRGQWDVKI